MLLRVQNLTLEIWKHRRYFPLTLQPLLHPQEDKTLREAQGEDVC